MVFNNIVDSDGIELHWSCIVPSKKKIREEFEILAVKRCQIDDWWLRFNVPLMRISSKEIADALDYYFIVELI